MCGLDQGGEISYLNQKTFSRRNLLSCENQSNTIFLVSCDWIVVAGEMLCKDSVTSGLPLSGD
jgi:hypothetical protein